MKSALISVVAVSAVMLIGACTQKQNTANSDKTHELMRESLSLACQYRDSIKLAKDSASVLRLMDGLDDALTKLNYRYPADIYINSSENQNDNLARVIIRTVELRDSILYRLAHPVIASDTVATDSLPPKTLQ